MLTFDQVSAPLLVGNAKNEITKAAVTEDAVYLFKKGEGIFRLDLITGNLNAFVSSVNLIDNTTFLIAPESVKEINEAVYFLSNRGAARIVGNSVQILSNDIDVELRNISTKATKAGTLNNIRAFGNEQRNLYGISFPADGTYITEDITYVLDLNTAQWTKFDFSFTNALVKEDGRLVTTHTNSDNTWNYVRSDVYSVGLNDDADQYDLEVDLTGASFANSGTDLVITRADATTYLGNIGQVIDYQGDLELYYYDDSVEVMSKVTAVKDSATQITLTFDTTAPAGDVADKLYIGVNFKAEFNRFYIGGPSDITQFSKYHLFAQNTTNLTQVGFETSNCTDAFDSGNYVTFAEEYDIMTTAIPRTTSRGNWVTSEVRHNYPQQNFSLDGFSWIYRQINSDRVERD